MRIGVVGMGLRGGLAFLAHRPDQDISVVALADPDESVYGRFREKVGAEAFVTDDARRLTDQNLDAVFVLSPDDLHEEHACLFLEAGIPVYLEKPMAITIEGCDRILQTAMATRTKLYLGHNMRHFQVVRKMKEWIDKGMIGQVKTAWCRHFVSYGGDAYFCDWHAERKRSTGLLLQKGAHDIDVLHWLCGGYSTQVVGMGDLMVYGDLPHRRELGTKHRVQFTDIWPPKNLTNLNPVIDVEDVNLILMRLDNGVLASYEHCMFTPDAWRNYTIIGDEGRIENFGDSPGSKVCLWDFRRQEPTLTYDVPHATGGHGGSDNLIVDEFLRFLREGGPTETSPVAARMAVAAGFMATESVRNGAQPRSVPGLDPKIVRYFEAGQA